MNKLRKLRVVVLPLLVGLMTTSFVYVYIQRLESAGAIASRVDVVVVNADLPAKTLLTEEMLTVKQIPEEFVTAGVLSRREDAVGKVTTVALAAGEIVMQTKLALESNKNALAYHIPANKRAVTIAINEIIGVAGFIQAGDAVDVYSTFAADIAGREKTVLVLENLPVLAVVRDTKSLPEQSIKEIKAYTCVTLAVTPEEAGRLIFAEERGQLRLALRPVLDKTTKGRLEFGSENLTR